MHDFDHFERNLAEALRSDADASVGSFTPASIARVAIADTGPGTTRVRRSSRPAGRFGRGRGMTLLAAAALLLVGGALAAGSGLLRLPTVVSPVPEPSVVAVATASPDATSPGPSASAAPSASPNPVAGPRGVWIPTGTMVTPSFDHVAVRLADGRVLVAGGSEGFQRGEGVERSLTSAGLYDPASGTWSATGNMLKPQAGFPPTLLLDGKVLVGHVEEPATDRVATIGAEVYDPASGTWTATGKMVRGAVVWAADFGSTATLLRDGRLLVAGQAGAQLYDPDSGSWSATGPMTTPRHSHTATLLRDGRVLAVGGFDGRDGAAGSAELYDPDTGSWTAIASTQFDPGHRYGGIESMGWATLLQDGTLLYVRSSGEVEIYDPGTGTWAALTNLTEIGQQKALLSDGTVLMARLRAPNGEDPPCMAAALYNPHAGSWTTASSMLRCGDGSSFTPMLDGTILAAGGSDCLDDTCVASGAAELFVPAGVSLPVLPGFPSPAPPVFPSPTPRPTPYPPATGPVPPNARPWTVTVANDSSQPVMLFLGEDESNTLDKLCGSVTPNVVPARVTEQVTLMLPAKDVRNCALLVNPRPGDPQSLVGTLEAPKAGKVWITADGQISWLGP